LNQLMHPSAPADIMLLKAAESPEYLRLISEAITGKQTLDETLYGGRYQIENDVISFHAPLSEKDNFASCGQVVAVDWVEGEQLFGCIRQHNGRIQLEPGLIHQANGGVLVLSLRSILTQPMLWLRLKKMVTQKRFDWLSHDEKRQL